MSGSGSWRATPTICRSEAASRALEGWQSFGILQFQTGQPFTVSLLADDDNSNTGIDSLGFGANDRPNVVGNPRLSNPTAAEWFNTAAFAIPPYGTFGNSGRNTVEGPGMATVDLSLVKNAVIREHTTLQVPLRDVQCVKPHELRAARQLHRLAHVWADSFGRQSTPAATGVEAAVLAVRVYTEVNWDVN